MSSQVRFYATHRWETAFGCSWGRQTVRTVAIFRPVSNTCHVSCRRSDWRTLLTSTPRPTLNCFIGQLDQFWDYHSHTKGNTEITNCHHKHYMGDKKNGKTFNNLGAATKWAGYWPPGPSVEPACPILEDCTGGWNWWVLTTKHSPPHDGLLRLIW